MTVPSPVLVTGGAGYVGTALISRLLKLGSTVRALDWELATDTGRLSDSRVTWLEGDVRQPGMVRRAIQGCRSVVHLAAISDVASFELNPAMARSVNLEGLQSVLAEAAEAEVEELVLVTHCQGDSHHEFDRVERVRESVVEQALSRGLPTATLRVPPLCGWSPRMRFDLPLHHAVAREYFREGGTDLSPASSHEGLHLDDLLELLMLILTWPPSISAGGVYDLGVESQRRSDLAAKSEIRLYGGVEAELVRSPETEFGWKAQRTMSQARAELLDRLSRGQFPDALTSPAYHNAESLRQRPRGENRPAA